MRQRLIFVCTIALCFPLVLTGCGENAEQKAELERVKAELEVAKVESAKAETERDTLEKELVAVTKTRDELQGQVTKLIDENEPLRNQVDSLASSDKILTKRVNDLLASNKLLTEQQEDAADSRDRLKVEVAAIRGSNDGLQAQVHELTKQRDAAVVKAKEAQDRIAELTAKPKTMTEVDPDPLVPPTVASKTPVIEESPEVETPKVEEPKVEAVEPPTIHSFNTARAKIGKGQNATLSWHVSNAGSISIEPGIGSVSALGSTNVKPSKTTTYTLTATSKGGETEQTCKVEVR